MAGLALGGALLAACGPGTTGDAGGAGPTAPPPEPTARTSGIAFEDRAAEAGVTFVATAGDEVKRHLLETTGTGVAVGDADGDGDLDLAFAAAQTTTDWLAGRRPATNVLYRNDGDGTFTDVTASSGLGRSAWSHGVYWVDHDGDDDLDLYVTAWGPNALYRNDGDGTFTDVTAAAGVAGNDGDWSAGAAFGDLDGDGDLDLYVTNYCEYDLADPPHGGSTVPWKGFEVYRGPQGFVAQADRVYRNDGDGTFTDVTSAWGFDAAAPHYGLGVVLSDLDDDGDVDAYVANDSQPNFLWRNDGGRFTEIGGLSGSATNEDAKAQAGMGTDAADTDGDGRIDLIVTNFSHDWNTLYRNTGKLLFVDATFEAGLRDTYLDLAWGVQIADFDADGEPDVLIANGHIYPEVDLHPHLKTTYRQADRLLRGVGAGRFEDATAGAGPALTEPDSSRGLIAVDLDRDGRLDVVTSRLDQTPEILRNVTPDPGAWIHLRLRQPGANRHAVGARVTVAAGGRTWTEEVQPYGSYLSSGEAAVHVGLGGADRVERLDVRWPDGVVESFTDVPIRRFVILQRGAGPVAAEEPRS